jgi:predicted transcriptional regulator
MAPDRSRKAPDRLLTETELELMTILWELGGGTVNDVLERLPPDRPLAYTSVSTILRILEQKSVLRAEKRGRGHFYAPLVARESYQAFALGQVVGKVFDGDALALVKRLVDEKRVSTAELEAIREGLGAPKRRR